MKYIMFKDKSFGLEVLEPVIFSEALSHVAVASAMTADNMPLHGYVVESAGFINLDVQHCYGRSATLRSDSKPGDAKEINSLHLRD